MVVPEALLREIPVIASKGTPWEELNTHHCGWWVDMGVEPLRVALEEALSLPESKRLEMGKIGRNLVEEKYSIEAVAEKMIQLYKWILKEGEKPEFVY
jgi:glycosyltransferase involved in cell wall biosynthesis